MGRVAKNDLNSVSADEIFTVLAEKGVKAKCEQCEHPESTLTVSDKGDPVISDGNVNSHTSILIEKTYNPCYILYCKNCGYQRYFSAYIIYESILSNRAKGNL